MHGTKNALHFVLIGAETLEESITVYLARLPTVLLLQCFCFLNLEQVLMIGSSLSIEQSMENVQKASAAL